MKCYTCGKKYTSWNGLFYHKGVVHDHANDTYKKIKNRQGRNKLLRNLQQNRTEDQERNLDASNDENRGNDKFQFKSFITGYYHYRNIWTPKIGEELNTSHEIDNIHDEFSVSIIKDDKTIVGHVPWQIAKQFTALLKSGGTVVAQVTNDPVTMRRQGIRVPCNYVLCGMDTVVYDIKKNIGNIL